MTTVIEVNSDMCDACGVKAYVFAELKSGGTLAYCGSHGGRFMPRLVEVSSKIIDQRYLLLETR